jgi:hypothetical protein
VLSKPLADSFAVRRRQKGHRAAADDHSVVNVEAAATKDQNVAVVYVNWSCEDNGTNGKQIKLRPIIGDKSNLAEVMGSGVEKIQRMK